MTLKIILIALSSVLFSLSSSASVEIGHFRTLLKHQEFSELEKQQKQINDAYVRGDISWTEYYQAFDYTFFDRDFDQDWLVSSINRLEQSHSDSPYRLLNLGIYYTSKGFNIRGSGWISTVSNYQQKKMYESFSIANEYLTQALEQDPTLISAYQNLVRMAKTSSDVGVEKYIASVFEQGLSVKPDNYALAVNVLYSQLPIWGGSYEKMEQTISELKPHFDNNPGDYEKLVGIGLHHRIKKHIKKKRFKLALRELEPYKSVHSSLIQRDLARIYRDMGQWEKCYRHATLAVTEDPHSYAQGMLGYCSQKLEKWQESKQAFTNHARYSGVGAWNLYYLGKAYLYTGGYDMAYPLFKESIIQKADYRKYSLPHINYIQEHHPKQTGKTLQSVYQQLRIGD